MDSVRLLDRWGVKLGQTYVVETDPTLVAVRSPFLPGRPAVPVAQDHGAHGRTGRVPGADLHHGADQPDRGRPGDDHRPDEPASWAESDPNALKDPQSIKLDEGVDTPDRSRWPSPSSNRRPRAGLPVQPRHLRRRHAEGAGSCCRDLAACIESVFQFGGAVGNANLS